MAEQNRYCLVAKTGEPVEHEWTVEYTIQFCAICGKPRYEATPSKKNAEQFVKDYKQQSGQ